MALETQLRNLQKDLGELVAVHERGRSILDFASYVDNPVGFSVDVLGRDLWSAQRDLLEGIRENPTGLST